VGPKGDGTIDTPDVNILKGIGKWWKVNGEQSIRGTHQSPLDVQSWGESTMKGHTIYLHVMNWPTDGKLLVGGINRTATKAYLLCNRQKALPMKNMGENLEIQVPLVASDTVDAVIALQCNDLSKVTKHRLLAQNIASNEFRVFDATLSGHLKYGSEKKNFHWIEGWDSKDDMVSWNFSNVKAAKYQVSIDYEATEKDGDGGAYSVRIGDVSLKHDVRYGNRVMDDLGQIEIPAGDLKLEIRGENISGKELFRPRSIILTPIH
jgi:hypothetical protein